jgi:ADP-ribose pyrophosphatase YjhB (NUDIX family)
LKSSHNLRNPVPAADLIIKYLKGMILVKRGNPPDQIAFDHRDILNDYFTGRY